MEVVIPEIRPPGANRSVQLKPTRGAVKGTWGFVDTTKANAEAFIAGTRAALGARGSPIGPTTRKMAPEMTLSADQIHALAADCSVVVECFGDCGASLARSIDDAARLEALGVSAVVVSTDALAEQGRSLANAAGVPWLPILELPHPLGPRSGEEVYDMGRSALSRIETLVEAQVDGNGTGEPVQRNGDAMTLELSESWDRVVDEIYEIGWSDGLPVVPPTSRLVEDCLDASGLTPDTEMPPVPPRMVSTAATRWAANAVMAGARPEYFAAIRVATEALLDPAAALADSQNATNPSTPLIFFNGPIVQQLSLRAGSNCLGSGFRANATIGRAVRLILRNVGGERPDSNDLSTHGQPGKYSFCFAENESACPWEPWHVAHGFAHSDSVVTAVMANAPQSLFPYGCTTARELLDSFVANLVAVGHMNLMFATGPLLLLGPDHAGMLAREGMDRRAVQRYIYTHARIPMEQLPPNARAAVRTRRARWFEVGGDPTHVGVADALEDVHIVVAGGPGIHSCFISTSFSQRPVLRRVRAS